MEQAYNNAPIPVTCGKRPSLTTLVTERFSDELFAEINDYCLRQSVRIRPVSLRKVIATQYEIDGGYLYIEALVNCIQTENETDKPIIMIVDAVWHAAVFCRG